MFGEPETLIIVYKDELLLNQIKKLIESNDDTGEGEIVGIEDGSVRVVAWTEKVWEDQKTAGNISNKVLFLGDVKGSENLLPVIDTKFNEYGIQYGWAGTQALLIANVDALDNKRIYNEFLDKLAAYPVPDTLKSDKLTISDEELIEEAKSEGEHKKNFFTKVGGVFKNAGKFVANNISPAQRKKLKQQYYFGIMKFYENHLAEFMKQ